jgi:N-formylglutamate amidohydrolase
MSAPALTPPPPGTTIALMEPLGHAANHTLHAGTAAADAHPPFVLVEPVGAQVPLVLASPHSGRRYPPELIARSRLDALTLRRSEDVAVDALVAEGPEHGAALLAATHARAWVDLNRDATEIDLSMFDDAPPGHRFQRTARVQAGLGAIPRVVGEGLEIYGTRIAWDDAQRRIDSVWRPFHAALTRLVRDTRERHGAVLLIDCHSMPSAARGVDGADIVLGDRFGQAAPARVAQFAQGVLERMGYRVARNSPYAGGFITQTHGRPAARQYAMQIEISRGIYLDEATLEPSARFERLRRDLGAFLAHLADATDSGRLF